MLMLAVYNSFILAVAVLSTSSSHWRPIPVVPAVAAPPPQPYFRLLMLSRTFSLLASLPAQPCEASVPIGGTNFANAQQGFFQVTSGLRLVFLQPLSTPARPCVLCPPQWLTLGFFGLRRRLRGALSERSAARGQKQLSAYTPTRGGIPKNNQTERFPVPNGNHMGIPAGARPRGARCERSATRPRVRLERAGRQHCTMSHAGGSWQALNHNHIPAGDMHTISKRKEGRREKRRKEKERKLLVFFVRDHQRLRGARHRLRGARVLHRCRRRRVLVGDDMRAHRVGEPAAPLADQGHELAVLVPGEEGDCEVHEWRRPSDPHALAHAAPDPVTLQPEEGVGLVELPQRGDSLFALRGLLLTEVGAVRVRVRG